MALVDRSVIIGNLFMVTTRYRFEYNNEGFCFGYSDLFNIGTQKSNMIDVMQDNMNNYEYGLINKYGLIAVITEALDEDNYNFKVYKYNEDYSYEYYIKNCNSVGFGSMFIDTI